MLHLCRVIRYIGKQTKKGAQTVEYTQLITQTRDTAYRIAFSIVREASEAEDIVQDVYEKVWRARDAVLNGKYPRAYLLRMVHNLAIDRLRERQRTRHIDLTRQQSSSNSERDTELRDMATLTESIIASLPEKQRLAIHLRDVEGFEMAEIAEIIECDETGARMNLSRARKSVREQLLKIMNYGV